MKDACTGKFDRSRREHSNEFLAAIFSSIQPVLLPFFLPRTSPYSLIFPNVRTELVTQDCVRINVGGERGMAERSPQPSAASMEREGSLTMAFSSWHSMISRKSSQTFPSHGM